MIHLLVGPDHYLVERELRRIVAPLDPEQLNTFRYDKSATLAEVASAVATPGFFGTARVVVAEGLQARASGVGKAKKAEVDEIAGVFSSIAPGNTLVLVDTELHSVPKAIRDLSGVHFFEMFVGTPPRGSDLVAFVGAECARIGAVVERRAVQHVLDQLFPGDWQAPDRNLQYDNPPDIQTLVSELEKLATAAGGGEISFGLVTEMTHRETQDQLFPVVEAVANGNVRAALSTLGALGADDESAARVISQLVANAELAPIAAGLRENEAKVVAESIGQKPTRFAALQRSYTAASARLLGQVVIESDRKLKRGITRNPTGQLLDILITRSRRGRSR